MHTADLRVAGLAEGSGGLAVRVGVPLADVYLEFLAGRCRPNTVLAAGYDLKVFFSVVSKSPEDVAPADVLAAVLVANRNTTVTCPADPFQQR